MAALESSLRLALNPLLRNLLRPWTPSSSTLRWRTRKVNVQRPIPDHYVKARFKAALQPIYPDPLAKKPWYEVCGNVLEDKGEEEEYKYERLLADEFYRNLSGSKLIAIYQENSTKGHELMKIRIMLHGHKMKMINNISTKMAGMALSGTELEPLLRLHVGPTSYLACEDLDFAKVLKFTKKMPTYVLLGGVVEGRLITRSQLLWCSTLPGLDMLRAQLCSILSSSTSRLSQNLTHHQQNLSRSLEEHIKQASTTNHEPIKDGSS